MHACACALNVHDLTHEPENTHAHTLSCAHVDTRGHTRRFCHALETDFLMKPSPSESGAEILTGPFLPQVHPPLSPRSPSPSPSAHHLFYSCFVVFLCCLNELNHNPLIYGYRQRQFYKQTGWWEGMTENILAEPLCVNLKMSVTVFLLYGYLWLFT